MKKMLSSLIILSLCAITHAESKTEIVVKKGIVKTTTAQGDSLVSPGQKAVLENGRKPAISMSNPMVKILLKLEDHIQKERDAKLEEIRYSSAQIIAVEEENLWKVGTLNSIPNKTDKDSATCRFGPTGLAEKMAFYDIQGRPLNYRIEKREESKGYICLEFSHPVAAGQPFRFMMISDFKPNTPGRRLLNYADGKWTLTVSNDTPYCLNYFHIILPPSAVYTTSTPAPQTIEETNGRVSITTRNYTGKEGHGTLTMSFLWPDKNGTCLEGIPWDKAGPEAVKIYELFIREQIQSPELWGELALKLVGGKFFEQAYDAFERCYQGHASDLWDYTALTWQGHLLDLKQDRAGAIEKYTQALAGKPKGGDMRHDQWGIVLTRKWIEERLNSPFTELMIVSQNDHGEFQQRFDSIPWTHAGHEILDLYTAMTQGGANDSMAWALLGLKLVGSSNLNEAMDCFVRAENGRTSDLFLFMSLVWQGHLLDLQQQRSQAVEKYTQALTLDDSAMGIRHDQWGIVLTKEWVQQRLQIPFTLDMLKQ